MQRMALETFDEAFLNKVSFKKGTGVYLKGTNIMKCWIRKWSILPTTDVDSFYHFCLSSFKEQSRKNFMHQRTPRHWMRKSPRKFKMQSEFWKIHWVNVDVSKFYSFHSFNFNKTILTESRAMVFIRLIEPLQKMVSAPSNGVKMMK